MIQLRRQEFSSLARCAASQGGDHGRQLRFVNRLGDVHLKARAQSLHPIFSASVSREGDGPDAVHALVRVRPQAPNQFVAVPAWHPNIADQHVERRSIRPATHSGMPLWQDKVFIGLAKSASDATDFFHIPTGRVVEVGTQVTV